MRAIMSAVLAVTLLSAAACSPPALKEYAYPAWGFAVSLRAAPTQTETAAQSGRPAGLKVVSVNAGRSFVIEVADGSASAKSDETILREFPQTLAQGGTLTSQTYVAAGPVTGRELLIDRPGEPTQRVRVFVSHRRLYALSARSPLGPKDPETEAFFSSFRLLP
jgi:hypothetical protein